MVLFLEAVLCTVYPCYKLSVGTWRTCTPLRKNSCGIGEQDRNAVCRRSDGNQVDLSYCSDYRTGTISYTNL